MKKVLSSCLFIASLVINATSAEENNSPLEKHPSYSELQFGAEHVTYSETLSNVAGLGQLSQDVSVVNPILKQTSYSGLNADWGFYIEGTSTLAPQLDKETWAIGEFGDVQNNDFKIQVNEIALKLSYNLFSGVEVTAGTRLAAFSFTRSHFAFSEPGAKKFDDALIALPREDGVQAPRFLLPGQSPTDESLPLEGYTDTLKQSVSITETQLSILMTSGIKYDSYTVSPSENASWFIASELSIPMYNQVLSTQFETVSLTEYFNGWGISGKAGARYHINKSLAIVAAFDVNLQKRNAITDALDNGARIRVPDVEYTNTSVHAGLFWSY